MSTIVKCEICSDVIYRYKCPKCLTKYCSVPCFKKHKEHSCRETKDCSPTSSRTQTESCGSGASIHADGTEDDAFETEDKVSQELLDKLGDSKRLKELLQNPDLQEMIGQVDSSSNVERDIDRAMKNPMFVDFADACLHVVEPPSRNCDTTSDSDSDY